MSRCARAYLVTDQMATETSARHSQIPRELDNISRNPMPNASTAEFRQEYGNPGQSPVEIMRDALRTAPEEEWEIGDLTTITGMTRTTFYRYLRDLISEGRAYQVSHGR